jgi:hypothetical protein
MPTEGLDKNLDISREWLAELSRLSADTRWTIELSFKAITESRELLARTDRLLGTESRVRQDRALPSATEARSTETTPNEPI